MKHHPEQLEGEIYMGNARNEDLAKSGWRTSRLGNVALSATGKASNQPSQNPLRPWFIKVSEVEERIGVLQGMIDGQGVELMALSSHQKEAVADALKALDRVVKRNQPTQYEQKP